VFKQPDTFFPAVLLNKFFKTVSHSMLELGLAKFPMKLAVPIPAVAVDRLLTLRFCTILKRPGGFMRRRLARVTRT
jgi:hypothetical protein